MNDREKLLKRVQMYQFAVTDAALFLDTHPDCAQALAYYNKYKKLLEEAKNAYEKAFGPLEICSAGFGSTGRFRGNWLQIHDEGRFCICGNMRRNLNIL